MIVKDPDGQTIAVVPDPYHFLTARNIPEAEWLQYTIIAGAAEQKALIRQRIGEEVGDLPDLLADLSDLLQVTVVYLARCVLTLVDQDSIAAARAALRDDPRYAILREVVDDIDAGAIRLTGSGDELPKYLERITTICDIKASPLVHGRAAHAEVRDAVA